MNHSIENEVAAYLGQTLSDEFVADHAYYKYLTSHLPDIEAVLERTNGQLEESIELNIKTEKSAKSSRDLWTQEMSLNSELKEELNSLRIELVTLRIILAFCVIYSIWCLFK